MANNAPTRINGSATALVPDLFLTVLPTFTAVQAKTMTTILTGATTVLAPEVAATSVPTHGNHVSLGAIIGPVIGLLILLLVIGFVLFRVRYPRGKHSQVLFDKSDRVAA
ncbi:hypothetical protein CPC08DRAFT_771832 [Agrocybe pediades]|nr:hypothetical protein CPC08DRAFT_771832 [Agrocybe pediades]